MVRRIQEAQVILVTGDDRFALPHEWDVIKDHGDIAASLELTYCLCMIDLRETECEVVIAG